MMNEKLLQEVTAKLQNARDLNTTELAKLIKTTEADRDNFRVSLTEEVKDMLKKLRTLMWDPSLLGYKYEYAPTFTLLDKEVMAKIDHPDFDGLTYDDLKMLNSVMASQSFGSVGSLIDPREKAQMINDVLVVLNQISVNVDYFDVLLQNMQNTIAIREAKIDEEALKSANKTEESDSVVFAGAEIGTSEKDPE